MHALELYYFEEQKSLEATLRDKISQATGFSKTFADLSLESTKAMGTVIWIFFSIHWHLPAPQLQCKWA